jgi:dTDP-4-amino-4,6-dideoxygalactose transaminase
MPIPSRIAELVHMAATYARSTLRRKPLYGVLGYPLWAAYNRRVGYADMSPLVLSRMYFSDFVLTLRRLGTLDDAIAKQRANASVYEKSLRLYPARLCLEKPGVHYNRYVYPILFPSSAQRDSMATYLHHMKIDTSRPYKDICKVAASYYGYSGDCPVAEQAAQKVLAIPSYHALRTTDIERIATRVNAGWAAIARP